MISYLIIGKNKNKIKQTINSLIKVDYLVYKIFFEERKKEYSINQIRNLIRETVTYSHKIRVYLFENFDLSSTETQNAFLKLLEEPPNNCFFILTTDNQLKILPTITSRLKLIYINDNNHQIKLNQNKEKLLDKVLISKHLKLISIDEINFQDLLIYFREKLKLKSSKKIIKILKEIVKTINLVESNNLNKQLALDNLLIMIYKEFNNNEKIIHSN